MLAGEAVKDLVADSIPPPSPWQRVEIRAASLAPPVDVVRRFMLEVLANPHRSNTRYYDSIGWDPSCSPLQPANSAHCS
jgi:hypothetical protein